MKSVVCSLGVLIFLVPLHLWSEQVTVDFPSPDKSQVLVWVGEAYRGDGTYYFDRVSPKTKIVSLAVQYGPMVNWFGNRLAEIFVPYGSPFNYSLIYDCDGHRLSNRFENLIEIFPDKNLVVFTDWRDFIFASIFPEKLLQTVEIAGLASSLMAIRSNFKIEISRNEITVGTLIEPYSFRQLGDYEYFHFRRKF